MDRRLPPALIGLTPGTLRAGAGFPSVEGALVAAVSAAAHGGLRGLMIREPHLEDGAFLRLARALREAFDGWLCVHDRVHLAEHIGAHGVHLTSRSLPPGAARRVVGSRACLSVSTHADVSAPDPSLVDFALHAPIFCPHSKESAGNEIGREGLLAALSSFDVPVVALGGVDPQRLSALKGTGALGCAAIGAIWGTDSAPIDGALRSPLHDLDAIEARTSALVRASAASFGVEQVR
ncbi:MAG: thiamine phosphate synthase [Planctomycetota bacterium]|nr:thiamine phosphate synthase [Planctomycetota bacterium]